MKTHFYFLNYVFDQKDGFGGHWRDHEYQVAGSSLKCESVYLANNAHFVIYKLEKLIKWAPQRLGYFDRFSFIN